MKNKIFFAMVVPVLCFGADFTREQICKATIATVMFKQPSIMVSKKLADGDVKVFYARNDGTKWAYKCKINEQNILWGSIDGRWRNEDIITYSTQKQTITINKTTSGTERIIKSFEKNQL